MPERVGREDNRVRDPMTHIIFPKPDTLDIEFLRVFRDSRTRLPCFLSHMRGFTFYDMWKAEEARLQLATMVSFWYDQLSGEQSLVKANE
jgi:hypothetical protein